MGAGGHLLDVMFAGVWGRGSSARIERGPGKASDQDAPRLERQVSDIRLRTPFAHLTENEINLRI